MIKMITQMLFKNMIERKFKVYGIYQINLNLL